jgi:microbial collagenase
VDLYVTLDGYPSTTSYIGASANAGNSESVHIAAPTSGRWFYIMLNAKNSRSRV